MKHIFSIRLDPAIIDKIKKIADSENRSIGNLIETILKDWIAKYEAKHQ